VTPIRVDALPSFGASNPLGTAAAIIKQATRARLGAYARAATAVVPVEPIAARMSLRRRRSVGISSGEEPFYNEGDRGFLAVMSEPHQFSGYTVDGWRPPISPELAIRDISRWARDAGLSVL
jgi:hypothetical protein